MGYKVLGFIVWQGAKLYMRRNHTGPVAKAAAAGVGVAVAAGIVLGGRQASRSSSDS